MVIDVFDFYYTQLNPPPKEPVFLVTLYGIILGLMELSDVEDMGLDYSLRRAAVLPIRSPSLAHTRPENERGEPYDTYGSGYRPL